MRYLTRFFCRRSEVVRIAQDDQALSLAYFALLASGVEGNQTVSFEEFSAQMKRAA